MQSYFNWITHSFPEDNIYFIFALNRLENKSSLHCFVIQLLMTHSQRPKIELFLMQEFPWAAKEKAHLWAKWFGPHTESTIKNHDCGPISTYHKIIYLLQEQQQHYISRESFNRLWAYHHKLAANIKQADYRLGPGLYVDRVIILDTSKIKLVQRTKSG